ncbi:isochorismatase family protein [Actinocorallia sp. B10E7]|uniref:cysteine hydrolase family protein n=1 Tax=Actinocorallia sp. B10E7 TaxID=3153558 RepID=UPI00325C4361
MKRAHIVIDVQESFRRSPLWEAVSEPRIVQKVTELVEGARAKGEPVVWVLHSAEGSGTPFDPALGFVRLMDGLEPAEGEPVLLKSAHNAFTTTRLQQLLTSWGIGEVTVSGIRTEQCCEATARMASDLGFEVLFVTEATATHPLAHPDAGDRSVAEQLADPRTLPAEEVIRRTEYALAGRFARIVTIKEAVA